MDANGQGCLSSTTAATTTYTPWYADLKTSLPWVAKVIRSNTRRPEAAAAAADLTERRPAGICSSWFSSPPTQINHRRSGAAGSSSRCPASHWPTTAAGWACCGWIPCRGPCEPAELLPLPQQDAGASPPSPPRSKGRTPSGRRRTPWFARCRCGCSPATSRSTRTLRSPLRCSSSPHPSSASSRSPPPCRSMTSVALDPSVPTPNHKHAWKNNSY